MPAKIIADSSPRASQVRSYALATVREMDYEPSTPVERGYGLGMNARVALILLVGCLAFVGVARADEASYPGGPPHRPPPRGQPRDWPLDPLRPGTFLTADAYTVGGQGSLEKRIDFDGGGNQLLLRAGGLASIGYTEAAAHVDLRLFLLNVGMSGGYRHVWRNYTCADNDPSCSIQDRLDIDKSGGPNARGWPFAEWRARLVIPLDLFSLVSQYTVRYEGSPDRTFDWFYTSVHDGGFLHVFQSTLFLRSARYGAIGPTVRAMEMGYGGQRTVEGAVGLNALLRPGFFKKDDLFVLQFLISPGNDTFGFHILRIPIYGMLIYRKSFELPF